MRLDSATSHVLRSLLVDQRVAALATLHDGLPFASLVPFAATVATGRLVLVTHVSELAAHTRDMRSHADVCLLIAAAESIESPPQALPRVSIQVVAEFVPRDHPTYAVLEAAYLAKFPDAAGLFSFRDFSLVALVPASARLVAGFARAVTLSVDALHAVMGLPVDPRRDEPAEADVSREARKEAGASGRRKADC